MPSALAFDMANRRLSSKPAGGETALYPDLRDDTLYAVFGTGIVPLFAGAPAAAVYRTPVFVLDNVPAFAWLQLEGPVTSAVAKLYGDGVLRYTTPTISGNDPVRVPGVRCREWEIVVESDGRVTGVTLASSVEELR